MSHPISTSMEYIKSIKRPPYYERGGYEDDEESEDSRRNDSESRLHNFFRKMSINIQRDEGTPDRNFVTGTAADPSEQERALMLNIPHGDGNRIGETFEDATLPTLEEYATNDALEAPPATNNYFENPFESDTTSTEDTVVKSNTGSNVHPLSNTINNNSKRKNESHGRLSTVSPDELLPAYTTQGNE